MSKTSVRTGHCVSDRSLSEKIDPNDPEGLIVHSFAGDSVAACREHVLTAFGLRTFRRKSLGNLFAEACKAARVEKSAHGLRKAETTNAANHGATVAELETIFGWAGSDGVAVQTITKSPRIIAPAS